MQIIVKGLSGEGKTTIALLIKEALEREGINGSTFVEDEKLDPIVYTVAEQRKRIIAIKQNDIKIQIVQEREAV